MERGDAEVFVWVWNGIENEKGKNGDMPWYDQICDHSHPIGWRQ